MKILQINTVCGTGSIGRIATDLYKVYEEAGHECVIAYGRGSAPEGIKSIRIGSNLDMYMHGIKTRVLDKHGFGSIGATKRFIEKVKKYNPDVIHLHNIHGYYINIELLFKYLKESGKKIIWTLHDCWAFTGHCAYFDYVGCEKWKNECKECPQKGEYPASNLSDNSQWSYSKKKEIFNLIDKEKLIIITPSMWLANLVKKSYLKKYKVEVINNGIDLDIFKPTQSNFREKHNIGDKIVLLGVANCWDRRKGLNYFVDLAKSLESNYQIVVVGVSEKQKKELSQNIIAITRTNNVKELVEIYSAADIFLNTSCEETMGLVTVEALACGTPVVVNNRTAITEVIDIECGEVFENNLDSLIEKIKNVEKAKLSVDMCKSKSQKYDKKSVYIQYTRL